MSYVVGDTPKCICDAKGEFIKILIIGKKYEIVGFDRQNNKDFILVINENKNQAGYYLERFQPYKEYQFEKEMNEIINEVNK